MTQIRLAALGLFFVVFLSFQTTRAQQTNPPANDQTAANQALRDKAFALLESLSEQLGSLQSAENRARMGSNIAEAFWTRDEKRARALFAVVQAEINTRLAEPPGEDDNSRRTFLVFLKLREDTIERIAGHDAEFALDFLKQTQPAAIEKLPNLAQKEHEIELRLARRIATQHPEIAVKLATVSLDDNFSTDLIPLLMRLSAKDKQQAATLYKEIVAKLRDTDLRRSWYGAHFAIVLARTYIPPAADDPTYRELLGLLVNKAVTYGCANEESEGQIG